MSSEKFIEYPKMKTLFKLIPSNGKGSKWDATNGEILPETASLHYLPMEDLVFTEKIDGVNMGIRIDSSVISTIQKRNSICNRENKGEAFYFELGDKITEIIYNKNIEELSNVIIYGELCGVKIQKGGNYFADRRFLIFDIYDLNKNIFFTWDAVKHFSSELGVEHVPEIIYTKDNLDVENVKEFVKNLKSFYNPKYNAEGIVIRYRKDVCNTRRWVAKIRNKDFQ